MRLAESEISLRLLSQEPYPPLRQPAGLTAGSVADSSSTRPLLVNEALLRDGRTRSPTLSGLSFVRQSPSSCSLRRNDSNIDAPGIPNPSYPSSPLGNGLLKALTQRRVGHPD